MSYLEVENKDFYNDINHRKEFIENFIDESDKDNFYIDDEFRKNNKMILNNYQKFITNFINPNTKFSRLLLCHSTGTGKTITSLATAINFIEIYKKEKKLNNIENTNSGMVYIIGFTKNIFKRELLSRPEFGIVSAEEIKNFNELKNQIIKYNLDSDKNTLKDLKIRYSIRLKSRKGNGYFEFIGYKKLVNKLLIKTDINYKLQISNIKDENELNTYIEKNILKLNYNFLDSFNKSLIICDEIHNVYNSVDINNWGLCLKIIFNYHSAKNSIRVLLLSATPINNKPIEIISLLELLNTNLTIKKNTIFDNNNNITNDGLNIIKKEITGKISYLKDMNLDLYPSKEIMGEKIPGIDYLKFIKCPMSNLHFQTYNSISKEYVENNKIKDSIDIDELHTELSNDDENDNIDIEEIIGITKSLKQYPINLELNNRYLNDFVIPDPESNNKKQIGLFIKNDIIKNITNATKKWKSDFDIDIIKDDKILKNTLTGDFLKEENIKKYSTKYYNMLTIIKDCIINQKGKIFLYHNFVQVSGINFIGEILKMNGVLELNDLPVKYSRCGICYDFKFKHEKIKTHEFIPIRFMSVSSLLTKSNIEKQLEQFNMDSNINGENIKIILGSQAIKESYDLKAVQNLLILHQPVNISTLIQIFGRAIRKNSHINLPIDKRNVRIFVLVSTMPKFIQDKSKKYIYTFEEMKYKYKINIYKIIQKINNVFIENAIDLNINYNINFPTVDNNTNDIYNIKHIDKKKLIKVDYSKLNLQTFQSYYYSDEINMCKYIIKRLLIEYSKVWTFDDLFKIVKNPYFKINFDSSLVSEYSFIIALDFLVYEKSNINILNKEDQFNNTLVNGLFDHNEKFILDLNNDINILLYIDEYYVLVPYNTSNTSNFYDGIKLDFDTVFRHNEHKQSIEIDLNDYIKDHDLNDFITTKKYLINKYSNVNINNMFNIITEYDFNFHLEMIEELIEYFFNLYTNLEYSKDVNHDFYINLLYFYNKFNIIIFANNLDNELNSIYEKYIISTKQLTFTVSDDDTINYNYNNLINSLEHEYNNLNNNNLQFSYYKKAIAETDNFLSNKNKKLKVFDYLLPVGHIFNKELRFYNPKKFWFNKLKFNKINMKFKDNNYIIGQLEKINIGFDIIFKLKMNNNNEKNKDKRKQLFGLNCLNIDKPDLYDICKKLKIDISNIKNRKHNICELIKFELIRLELEERKKESNIRYFYFYWE